MGISATALQGNANIAVFGVCDLEQTTADGGGQIVEVAVQRTPVAQHRLLWTEYILKCDTIDGSHEPQSRSIACWVASEVVSGSGVNKYGSWGGCMAVFK